MGLDLWKIKFEHISDGLTDEEHDFLERTAYQSDDGNYYIDEDKLKDALAEMSGKEVSKIQDLLDTLRTEFKKENDNGISFNFG